MKRADDGSITLTTEESDIVRAALFTIEHYMNQVWDSTEVRMVSGFTVESFAALREALDASD